MKSESYLQQVVNNVFEDGTVIKFDARDIKRYKRLLTYYFIYSNYLFLDYRQFA